MMVDDAKLQTGIHQKFPLHTKTAIVKHVAAAVEKGWV